MLQYKNYYMPKSVDEMLDIIEGISNPYKIISGATDLYAKEVDISKEQADAIDISSIESFSKVEYDDNTITFGSNTTIQSFLEDDVLLDRLPLMKHAAIYFAEQQIREVATIGGNLANGSPSGDMIPPMVILDAIIHTVKLSNHSIVKRDISIHDFIKGVGKTALEDGEVIASITCPILVGYGYAFKKVGMRRSLCISTVNSAFAVKTNTDGTRFDDVRIAFGGVAPRPTRLIDVENYLKGKNISKKDVEEGERYIPEDIVQSRSRREYRNTVIKNFYLAGIYESIAETTGMTI